MQALRLRKRVLVNSLFPVLTAVPCPCRDSYWPNGILAETPPRRDKNIRMRTRVAAKTILLGIMPGLSTHPHSTRPLQPVRYTELVTIKCLWNQVNDHMNVFAWYHVMNWFFRCVFSPQAMFILFIYFTASTNSVIIQTVHTNISESYIWFLHTLTKDAVKSVPVF